MNELIIDRLFDTRQELEEYEERLAEKYIVFMIIRKDQTIGNPEIYGIEKVIHFGERK